MKLELGKTYETRNGYLAKIENVALDIFFGHIYSKEFRWLENGAVIGDTEYDIVKENNEWKELGKMYYRLKKDNNNGLTLDMKIS